MKCKVWNISTAILLTLIIVMVDSSTARSLFNERRMAERDLTREANSADEVTSTNPQVDDFIAELANLSIPHYLKDLYLNFTFSDGRVGKGRKANTIRSYANTAKSVGCGYYKFEVDKDKVDREEIVHAELHLFQANSSTLPNHYHVHIFYLLRAKDLESPLQLTFKHMSPTVGWHTFDITPIAESWKQQGWVNHGLLVKLTTKDNQQLPCDGVFAKDTIDTEPSLVVYTHDHDSKFFEGLLKKEEKTITKHQRRKRNSNSNDDNEIKVHNVGCHRKELIVKRESLSSSNIKLMLPIEFDAGACEGHCRRIEHEWSPMSYTSVVSLHYLHTVGLEKAPSRCCVPTSFDNVKMMFFIDTTTEQRIFKKNVPVIAKKCGCF